MAKLLERIRKLGRIAVAVAALAVLAGCSEYLDHLAAPFNSLVTAVIVDLGEGKGKVEAGWTITTKVIRAEAEEGCLAQRTSEGKKVPTLPLSSSCAGVGCLTRVYVFACYTEKEMKELPKTLAEYVPDEYK